MGKWWRTRIENLDLFDETYGKEAKTNPWFTLGGIAYLSWMIVIGTGVWLMFSYIPTVSQAWMSIERIQNEQFLGWLARGLHKYGADALIIALTMRLYRMFFRGEYRAPGELSWIFGIIGLILAMISGLTGYLLIWNQRAYWASQVVFAQAPVYLDELPIIGQLNLGHNIANIFMGGLEIGQATLTRMYALHFGISAITLILVEAHFYFKRNPYFRLPRMNLDRTGVVLLFGILAMLSLFLPAKMGQPADRLITPHPILSDWYFLGLYQMIKIWPALVAVLMQTALPLIAMLMPWMDRTDPKKGPDLLGKRRFWIAYGTWALVGWLVFSYLLIVGVASVERDPPIFYAVTTVWLGAGLLWQFWPQISAQVRKRFPRAPTPRKPRLQGGAD